MLRSALPKIATALVIGAAIALAPTAAFAQTMLDTTPNENGFIDAFGAPGVATPTYGQVVTAPAVDTILTDYSIKIAGATDLIVRSQVFAWNGTRATGTALYTSEPTVLTGVGAAQPLTFSTGGLQLTAGAQYVLLTTSLLDAQTSRTFQVWQSASTNPYPGGDFVYSNAPTEASRDAVNWSQIAYDAVFTARFEQPIVVTSAAPATGSTMGGTAVVITGTNLDEATGVLFGSVAATSFVVDSDTQITAIAPAQAAGTVDVFVQGDGFAPAAAAGATFTYAVPAAVVAAALPDTGFDGSALPLAALLLAAGVLAVAASRRGRRSVTA